MPGKKKWISAGEADLTFRVETAHYTDMEHFTLFAENVKSDALPNITDIRCMPEFSGKIRYTCTFTLPEGITGLDLGNVGQTCHLWCGGNDLGVRVCPPYRYDLSGVMDEDEALLVIEVSNTLGNAIRDYFTGFMAIPMSGLTGKLTWLKSAE